MQALSALGLPRRRHLGGPVRLGISFAAATATMVALSPAASAASNASVARVSTNVTYNSGAGAVNAVVLSENELGQVVVADSAGLAALFPCRSITAQSAQCGTGVSELNVLLADGGDEVTQETPIPTRVQGSDDNNVLRSGRAPAEAATLFLGGSGFDTVEYTRADRFVTVTADGLANDGRPGDRDNIAADVEHIIGSGFPDRITGSAVDNRLDGAFGPDVLTGLGGDDLFPEGGRTNGADLIVGGAGFDTADFASRTSDLRITLDGLANDGQDRELDDVRQVEAVATGSGDDLLGGARPAEVLGTGAGDDELLGRGGDDRLTGGAGSDVHRGGAGNDTILARDGERDVIECGPGALDEAVIDSALDVVRGCEILA